MKPAAPVTRIRTAPSYASLVAFLPLLMTRSAEPHGVPDRGAVTLELARPVEMLERLIALPELRERGSQVVFGVRLVTDSGAPEGGDSLPRDTLGALEVAGPEEPGRLIG